MTLVRVRQGWLTSATSATVLSLIYAATVGLVSWVSSTTVGEPAFNPALGVAVGMAILIRRRGWAPLWMLGVAVVLGEWLGWLWSTPPPGTLPLSLAHGLALVVAATAIEWLLKQPGIASLELRSIAATLMPPVAAATTVSVFLLGSARLLGYQQQLLPFAWQWWLKDALGLLLLTPLALSAQRAAWRANGPTLFGESVAAASMLVGTVTLIFTSPERSHSFPAVFVTVWIALRFGLGPTSLSVLLVATATSLATGLDQGPFAGTFALDWTRVFIAGYAVMALTVSVLATQRGRVLADAVRAHDQLAHASSHDELTGLFTRPHLEKVTAAAISGRPVGESWIALISIDLDDFASVNVRYGRAHADAAIAQIGRRLQVNRPPAACVARIGGDEYGLLLTEMSSESDAIAVAEQLRELVCVPVVLGSLQFTVTGSVGIAVTNDGDSDQLLRDAEAALHDAKERGRNRLAVRTLRDRERARGEQRLLDRFPRALAEREFGCVYQPIVSLTGRSHGVEVLARWYHPEQGLLLPAEFLPVLQRSGVMGELSDYLFDMAVRQVHRWAATDPHGAPAWLSVNISADELIDLRLPRRIRRVLDASGVRPQHLMVEITEQTMVSFTAEVRSQLEEIRSMGVRVAVDDFGTGFSGLAYLTNLPIDVLKIDRQFLIADENPRAHVLLRSVCALARDLGLFTIVEGVESAAELDQVRDLGADAAQGWYLGRPESADKLLGSMPRAKATNDSGGEGGI
ncbi:MAG: EAL domain-containing protein [Actinobacteria bacterium]|nr:EAL domain-containing protein [Actinomycetota bacterium]